MKIAIFVSLFPPEGVGGTEIASFYMAKYLAERGHEVHVITKQCGKTQKNEYRDKIYIHRLFYKEFLPSKLLYLLIALLYTISLRPDIVHGQMIFPSGLLAVITQKLFLKHNTTSVTYARGSDVYLTKGVFFKFIGKFILNNSDILIVLTNDMKNNLIKFTERNDIYVLPNGIEHTRFNLDRPTCRKMLNFSDSERIILFVGRLIPIKGIEYLIKAFEIVLKFKKNIKLIIIGDGVCRERLEYLADKLSIKSSIQFTVVILQSAVIYISYSYMLRGVQQNGKKRSKASILRCSMSE